MKANFFYNVLTDGLTEKGAVENELLVLLFCQKDDTLQQIQTRLFSVLEPSQDDAEGLV